MKKQFTEITPCSELPIHKNSVIDRVFRNRGISSEVQLSEALDYSLSNLLSPDLMKGMKEAVKLIYKHIENKSSILVYCDFDSDGINSGALSVEALRLLGARNVNYIIPNRKLHGYGLTPEVLEVAKKYDPDLIITVDNGISSFAGAKAVKKMSKQCDLLITDHHLAPASGLPEANVIVNPNQPGCTFPSKSICGCGVIFYVMLGLRKWMRDEGKFKQIGITEPSLASVLDLVAVATVADVVSLDKNNRILVSAGLKYINQGRGRPGIEALLRLGNRKIGEIQASDCGFCIGPRLNSSGRLEDASLGIKCLLEKNETTATALATELDQLNQQRKSIEHIMTDEAVNIVDKTGKDYYGVCLYQDDWHEGVIGIVASRVKDRLNRPVIAFTSSEKEKDEGVIDFHIKGSARSVEGVHLHDVLTEVSNKSNFDIVYGGHAMAAGLTIKISDLNKFKELFDFEVRKHLTKEMIEGAIKVDIKNIPFVDITLDNAEQLIKYGPFGQGFLEPSFSRVFRVKSHKVVGEKHVQLNLIDNKHPDREISGIIFNILNPGDSFNFELIEASFKMGVNKFRGKTSLQLMIDEIQEVTPIENPEPEGKLLIEGLNGKSVRHMRQ